MRILNLLVLLICGTTFAQQVAKDEPQTVKRIELFENTSRTFELGSKLRIKSVDGYDETVLRIDPISPEQVRFTGLKKGWTDLKVTDENQKVMQLEVRVCEDMRPVRRAIEELFPSADIDVFTLNNGSVVLRGTVRTTTEMQQVIEVCETFYDIVLNHLRIVSTPRQVVQLPTGKRPISLTLDPSDFEETPTKRLLGKSFRIMSRTGKILADSAKLAAIYELGGKQHVTVMLTSNESSLVVAATKEGGIRFVEHISDAKIEQQIRNLHNDVKRLIELLETRQGKVQPNRTNPSPSENAASTVEPGDQVLAFVADWCRVEPKLEALLDAGHPITRVQADRQVDLVEQYGIEKLPTFVILRDDREIDRLLGSTGLAALETSLTQR